MTSLLESGSERTSHSTVRVLLRLRRWAGPHRRAFALMLAAATGAMLAQAVIPLVIGAVVDGPISTGDTAGLWALSGLALLFGLVEAALFFARRQAMARAALGVETDLRRDLFAHLQRLPASFHDRWPSGQLLSRLTIDLATLRRFVGLAAVFMVADTVTIAVMIGLMLHLQVWLGLIVLAAMAPLLVATRRFELRYAREARHAQDLTGDVATAVEESALGIRVIKSFGRRPHMLEAFTGGVLRLRRAELDQDRHAGPVLGAARGAAAARARRRHRRRRLRHGPRRDDARAISSPSSRCSCSWCGRSSCWAGCSR